MCSSKLNVQAINLKLVDYLTFYNTERPHKNLGLKSPIYYHLSEGHMSNKSVTYTVFDFLKKMPYYDVNIMELENFPMNIASPLWAGKRKAGNNYEKSTF